MDQNGGDNTNNLNDSNFLSIDHSSPIEQPVDPVKDVNPVDIYSPETIIDSPNIAPSVSASVANEIATDGGEAVQQSAVATEPAQATQTADSNIQTTQATAYDYSNAFGIAATDDTNTIKKAGSATDMSGFEGSTETPQFFSEAMENAITSGKPAKKERKSRTARKDIPTPAAPVVSSTSAPSMGAPIMLNNAQPERRGGRAKLFIIVAIVLALIGGGIALAFHLTDSGVIYDHNGLAKQLRELGNLVIYGEEKDDELPELSSISGGFGLGGLFNEYGELDTGKVRTVKEKYDKIAIVGSQDVKDDLKQIGTQIGLLSYYANTYKSITDESLIALYNLGGREASLKDIENIFNQKGADAEFSESSYAEMALEYATIRLINISDYDAAGCIVENEIDLRCASIVRSQKTTEERAREGDLERAIDEAIWNGADKLVEQIIDVEGEVK